MLSKHMYTMFCMSCLFTLLGRTNPFFFSSLFPMDNIIYDKTRPFLLQMEKYSKHLEMMVAERTQDLILEKQRTDQLLHGNITYYIL